MEHPTNTEILVVYADNLGTEQRGHWLTTQHFTPADGPALRAWYDKAFSVLGFTVLSVQVMSVQMTEYEEPPLRPRLRLVVNSRG